MGTKSESCLILGFTGPLGSGCSTAAKYFIEDSDKSTKGFKGYKNLETFNHLEKDIKNYYGSEKSHDELIEVLKNRELKTALGKKFKVKGDFKFYEISMSSMILKYVIEYCSDPENDNYNESQENYSVILRHIKHIIDYIKTTNDIKSVNECIKNKNYMALTQDKCDLYDKYLADIKEAKEKIKNLLKRNKYITLMQDLGDNIKNSGNPFNSNENINYDTRRENVINIAESVNNIIKYIRYRNENNCNNFIIESLRNPFEVEHLRSKYYGFYLISITAKLESRKSRETDYDSEIDKRDMGTKDETEDIHKNNVSKCVYLSDIQIDNSLCDPELLNSKLIKYLALILSPGCITPTDTESLMNQAYMLSFKSTCISHQVGAIIVGKDGYIVGAGWNDVGEGQIGCGLRQIRDIKNIKQIVINPKNMDEKEDNFRTYLLAQKKLKIFCYKDMFSMHMALEKAKQISKSDKIKNHINDKLEKAGEKKINVAQLCKTAEYIAAELKPKQVECCRAVHAEENAFLQSAKIGGTGVSGGTLYTTFFPCEICAKTIYQSGIKEVVYVEPYPDSVSEDVFLKDGIRKIILTPFEGVKSHSFYRLFKASYDKKERQRTDELEDA